MNYKAPAFPYIDFEIKKEEGKKEYYVIELTTQLKLPGNSSSKNSFKKTSDAAEWINNNFGLTDQQIEFNKSSQGTLSPKSIAWNFAKVNNIEVNELIPCKYENENDYDNFYIRFTKTFNKEYPLNKQIMEQAITEGYFNYLNLESSILEMIQNAYNSQPSTLITKD